jgi:hypothetical protein
MKHTLLLFLIIPGMLMAQRSNVTFTMPETYRVLWRAHNSTESYSSAWITPTLRSRSSEPAQIAYDDAAASASVFFKNRSFYTDQSADFSDAASWALHFFNQEMKMQGKRYRMISAVVEDGRGRVINIKRPIIATPGVFNKTLTGAWIR